MLERVAKLCKWPSKFNLTENQFSDSVSWQYMSVTYSLYFLPWNGSGNSLGCWFTSMNLHLWKQKPLIHWPTCPQNLNSSKWLSLYCSGRPWKYFQKRHTKVVSIKPWSLDNKAYWAYKTEIWLWFSYIIWGWGYYPQGQSLKVLCDRTRW